METSHDEQAEVIRAIVIDLYAALNRPQRRPIFLLLTHPTNLDAVIAAVTSRSIGFGVSIAADPSGVLVRRPGELFGLDMRKKPVRGKAINISRAARTARKTVVHVNGTDADDLAALLKNGPPMRYMDQSRG